MQDFGGFRGRDRELTEHCNVRSTLWPTGRKWTDWLLALTWLSCAYERVLQSHLNSRGMMNKADHDDARQPSRDYWDWLDVGT
ncbi:protein of unknown function [Pararobbsia alpina]